jgi:hypothetical protein
MVKYKDFEVIGCVWFKANGELKSNGVNVTRGDGRYFIYNNKKFPPGVYYLIRRHGRVFLISDEFLSSL